VTAIDTETTRKSRKTGATTLLEAINEVLTLGMSFDGRMQDG